MNTTSPYVERLRAWLLEHDGGEPRFDVVPGSRPLTRREAEIVRLAAVRWTDREIADALYISVRTVESHLASAYRKLGVPSRHHLYPMVAA
jgi:DNA-binding CsgD family transcriptional regulator